MVRHLMTDASSMPLTMLFECADQERSYRKRPLAAVFCLFAKSNFDEGAARSVTVRDRRQLHGQCGTAQMPLTSTC
jgi:hypothetical protein